MAARGAALILTFERGRLMSDADRQSRSSSPSADCDDNDNLCAAAKAGLPKRSSFAFSAMEDATLDVFRFLLATITTADAHHWNSALDYAEYHLGEEKGAALVMRATQLVRALLHQRRRPFSFLTSGCSHICEDELTLMTAMRIAQTGLGPLFQDTIERLAQSDENARLRRQIIQLSDFLYGDGRPAETPAPTLFPTTHNATLH